MKGCELGSAQSPSSTASLNASSSSNTGIGSSDDEKQNKSPKEKGHSIRSTLKSQSDGNIVTPMNNNNKNSNERNIVFGQFRPGKQKIPTIPSIPPVSSFTPTPPPPPDQDTSDDD